MSDGAGSAGDYKWGADPVTENMGIRREEISGGGVRATLDAAAEHCNVFGLVHGAILYAMADVAMGSMLTLSLKEFRPVATISIVSNYLRPTRPGTIVADTKFVRQGRSIATLQTEIRDGDGELSAIFTGTFHISAAQGSSA